MSTAVSNPAMETKMDNGIVRVLLVDVDPDGDVLAKKLLTGLTHAGVKLDWVGGYKSGLTEIAQGRHDAYLLADNLDGASGIQLVREALSVGSMAPLILLGPAENTELARQALEAGASDYLVIAELDDALLSRSILYSISRQKRVELFEDKFHKRSFDLERSNAALKSSEEFNRTIFECSPDCCEILDAEGRILSINSSGMDLLEIDDFQRIRGNKWESLWPEQCRERVVQAVSSAFGGTTDRFQAFSPTVKGTPKWWDVVVSPVNDDEGNITRIISVSRDVTDRIRANHILRESEERYKSLFDSIDEGYCVIEMIFDKNRKPIDYRFLEVNASFEKQTGIKNPIGRRMREIAPKHEPHWFQNYGEIALTGVSMKFENEAAQLGRWYDVYAYRFGAPEELQVAIRFSDITERKHEESRVALLARLGEISRTKRKPHELLYAVACDVGKSYGASRCFFNEIDLNDDSETVVKDYCHRGIKSVAGKHRVSAYSPLTSAEMKAGLTVVNQDSKIDPRTAAHYETVYRPSGERSYVAVPLMRGGTWVASLWLSCNRPRSWSDADVRLLEGIGERAWLAVEKLRSDAALREAEERRHLAETIGHVGVWDWNIESGTTYWSDTMWELYGEPKNQLNPDESYWSDHLHPDDRDSVKANLRQVVESTEADEFRDKFRILRADGTIRWVEAMGQVTRDALGRATRVCGVNLDITESKNAEERIKLSENQLRLVTDTVPALISYVDSSEIYRFVNQRFADWFGVPTTKLVGRRIRDVFGTEAYKVIKPEIELALAGKQRTFEATLKYKNAGERTVHISYVPDIGPDGSVYGYYGMTHDLTELKRSQDLLRYSEDRMAMIADRITDYAILSIDSGGKIDGWNKGAEAIFGYPAEKIVGLSWDILFTPEDIQNGTPAREMRTTRQKGRSSNDRWQRRQDGSLFFASGVTMPLYVGKSLTGYAKVVGDLTEKQRRAEELQRVNAELENRVEERTRELAEINLELVQEIHEREIAERQRIDLLGRLVTSQESERRRISRDIHDQLGQRLTALRLKIASLLEISKGHTEINARVERLQEIGERLDDEVGFLAWELRPTALDDLGLIEALGAFVNEWSRHTDIAAEFHSTGLANIRLDPEIESHLYRITQEALNNITKYAKAKNVTVLLEKRNDNAVLIVEDDGRGFNANSKRVPAKSGSGFGLIGMGERAALMGGEVEIESSVGKGTAIYIRVPIGD